MEALSPELAGPGYREAMRQTLEGGFFSPWDDPARKAQIVAAMTSAPQSVIEGAWRGVLEWNGPAAMAACPVPALYVAASEPRTDLAEMRRVCPTLLTAQVAGAGHFVQIEAADQVNAMLDRFFAIVARPA
jgi:pimeloyl-ACP methyl ester carboxylesterase